jgi:hypothetical protein
MEKDMVKTTILIPRELWRRAKVRAAETDADFRRVVIAALEAYLGGGRSPKKGGRSEG